VYACVVLLPDFEGSDARGVEDLVRELVYQVCVCVFMSIYFVCVCVCVLFETHDVLNVSSRACISGVCVCVCVYE
jgi:hypothetical protein